MNIAVVAAIISDGKILSVSRKTDSLDLGFPGGKVEIGESDEEALVREVFEETGISVNSCRFVDERIDADGFIVRMFVVDDFHGVVSTLESGVVSWVLPMQLCSDNCSFKKYNIDFIC
jgi:8-oxo-dGTP pyrophosphatase MutT (NUDIX family)